MVKCPACNQSPEIVGLFHVQYAHACQEIDQWMFSDGKTWSNSPLKGEFRAKADPKNHHPHAS